MFFTISRLQITLTITAAIVFLQLTTDASSIIYTSIDLTAGRTEDATSVSRVLFNERLLNITL